MSEQLIEEEREVLFWAVGLLTQLGEPKLANQVQTVLDAHGGFDA
jgi:hypothetical protein